MSELIHEPIATTEYGRTLEPQCEPAVPDTRLVSAAAVLLRWLFEVVPAAAPDDLAESVSDGG